MRLLAGYVKPIAAVTITPDGRRLFSVGVKHKIIWEWDVADARVVKKSPYGGGMSDGIRSLVMAPQGGFLVVADKQSVFLWPLDGGQLRLLPHVGFVGHGLGVAIDGKSRFVAAPLNRAEYNQPEVNGFQTWDLNDGARGSKHVGLPGRVVALAFSPDGKRLATASHDVVCLWGVPSGGRLRSFTPKEKPTLLAFHPVNGRLAVGGGRTVSVYEASGESVGQWKGHDRVIRVMAYSPDGQFLATAGADGSVIVRDGATHDVVGRRDLEIGDVSALCWLADSSGLVAGGEKLIAVCDVDELLVKERPKAKGEPLSLAGHGDKVQALAYSADGRALASWSVPSETHVWDLSRGAGQAKRRGGFASQHHETVTQLTWSPDGTRLAKSMMFGKQVYEADTGRVVCEIDVPGEIVQALALTPAGRLLLSIRSATNARVELRDGDGEKVLASIDYDRAFRFAVGPGDRHVYFGRIEKDVCRWVPGTGECVTLWTQPTNVNTLTVRADERLALTTGATAARLWSLPDGKPLAVMKHPLLCSGAAFAPDGRIVTACYDGVVRVWDAAGGSELFAFDLGMGRVYSLAVSPDGMTFAVGVHKKNRIVLMDLPE